MPDQSHHSAPNDSSPPAPAAASRITEASRRYLVDALQTPRPSGFEEPIQRLNRDYITPHADDVRVDIHGNLIATIGPAGASSNDHHAPTKLMFAGHCDQIGMLVSHIDDAGFIYAQTIGGWDPQQLIGQSMTIWTDRPGDANAGHAGRTDPVGVAAVISRKPIHLLSPADRKRVVELDELWLDIGAVDADDAKQRIKIGDPVTLDLRVRELLDDKISGPGTDNVAGMWTVIEALRRASLEKNSLRCELHSVATVQEEIGLRGAKTAAGSIQPDLAIAVDVCHASDCPTIDKNRQGDIKVGGGPVIYRGPNMNRGVTERLIQLAEQHDLPYQVAAIARATPNDANALQIHGGGVGVGLVAIPNRYMHSAVEVISIRDIDAAAELLSQFALSITPECSFVPGS